MATWQGVGGIREGGEMGSKGARERGKSKTSREREQERERRGQASPFIVGWAYLEIAR